MKDNNHPSIIKGEEEEVSYYQYDSNEDGSSSHKLTPPYSSNASNKKRKFNGNHDNNHPTLSLLPVNRKIGFVTSDGENKEGSERKVHPSSRKGNRPPLPSEPVSPSDADAEEYEEQAMLEDANMNEVKLS